VDKVFETQRHRACVELQDSTAIGASQSHATTSPPSRRGEGRARGADTGDAIRQATGGLCQER